MRKVSIIILILNGLDYTKKCLDSLKDSVIDEQNVDVYVVDNGSERDTIQYLEAIIWITLSQNGENLGFVRGNNVAIDQIKSGDIVLLNNDIIITQMNWLQQLQETAYEDEKNGVVGCRLINENGEFLHAGTYIYPETFWGQQIGGGQKDIGQYAEDRKVQGVVLECSYIKIGERPNPKKVRTALLSIKIPFSLIPQYYWCEKIA